MTAFTDQINTILEGLAADATPDEVLTALRDYSKRDIIAVLQARSEEAGGGSQPFTLLGPYTVNYNTAGFTSTGATLAALTAGTVIVRAFAIATVEFATTGTNPYIQLLAGPSDAVLVTYMPSATVGEEYTLLYNAATIGGVEGLIPTKAHTAVEGATSLRAYSDPDAVAWTAGQMHVYALTYLAA